MKQQELWRPSKYVIRKGRLTATKDVAELSVSSRLITELVAVEYQQALPAHAKGVLLDLGCGKVPLYQVYRELACETICLDWGNSIHGAQHADIVADLNQGIPLPDDACDTVLLSDVLEHIYRPAEFLSEIHRVLRTGGTLILNVPFLYGIHEAPYDFYRYTEFGLRALLIKSGFSLTIHPVGGMIDVLADLLAKLVCKAPMIGDSLAQLIQGGAAWFGRTRYGSQIRQRSSNRYPLGYFVIATKGLVT